MPKKKKLTCRKILNALKGQGLSDQRHCRCTNLQLKKGIKVEMEHTTCKSVAKKIAKDHLCEDPRYYTKLKKAGL